MAKQNLKNAVDWFITNKIKEIRSNQGLTQVDIAVHLNLTSGFVGQVESPNFKTKYNTAHLNELAKLF